MDGLNNTELMIPETVDPGETSAEASERIRDEQMTEDEAFEVIANAKFQESIDKVKFIAKRRFGRFLLKKVDMPYISYGMWDAIEQLSNSIRAMGAIASGEKIDGVGIPPTEVRVQAANAQGKLALSLIAASDSMRTWNDRIAKLPTNAKPTRNLPPSIGGNFILAESVTVQDRQSANSGELEDAT